VGSHTVEECHASPIRDENLGDLPGKQLGHKKTRVMSNDHSPCLTARYDATPWATARTLAYVKSSATTARHPSVPKRIGSHHWVHSKRTDPGSLASESEDLIPACCPELLGRPP